MFLCRYDLNGTYDMDMVYSSSSQESEGEAEAAGDLSPSAAAAALDQLGTMRQPQPRGLFGQPQALRPGQGSIAHELAAAPAGTPPASAQDDFPTSGQGHDIFLEDEVAFEEEEEAQFVLVSGAHARMRASLFPSRDPPSSSHREGPAAGSFNSSLHQASMGASLGLSLNGSGLVSSPNGTVQSQRRGERWAPFTSAGSGPEDAGDRSLLVPASTQSPSLQRFPASTQSPSMQSFPASGPVMSPRVVLGAGLSSSATKSAPPRPSVNARRAVPPASKPSSPGDSLVPAASCAGDFAPDAGVYMHRSFRVGWAPGGVLVHAGLPVTPSAPKGSRAHGANTAGSSSSAIVKLGILQPASAADEVARRAHSLDAVTMERVSVCSGAAVTDASSLATVLRHSQELPQQGDCTRSADTTAFPEEGRPTAPLWAVEEQAKAICMVKALASNQRDALNGPSEATAPGVPPSALRPNSSRLHEERVWSLVDALWGVPGLGGEAEEDAVAAALRDRESLSKHDRKMDQRHSVAHWLVVQAERNAAAYPLDQAVTGPDASNPDTEDALASMFNKLVVGDVRGASEVAMRNNDFRLALLIAQSAGPGRSRADVRQQLEDWQQGDAPVPSDFISRNRLKIYALLAGCLAWPLDQPLARRQPAPGSGRQPATHVLAGLDWRRCLSVHLWHLCPATACVAEAVATYDRGWQERPGHPQQLQQQPATRAPLPWYLEEPSMAPNVTSVERHVSATTRSPPPQAAPVDAAFSLLRLAATPADVELNMIRGLLPAASSPDPLEHGPGWMLYQAL